MVKILITDQTTFINIWVWGVNQPLIENCLFVSLHVILTFNQQIVALGLDPLPDKDTMKVSFDYEGNFF